MKTDFFRKAVEMRCIASLLGGGLLLLFPALLSAQNENGVSVTDLEVKSGMVTFHVGWGKSTIPHTVTSWSDTVWVFIDYNDKGTMKRLPLLTGATLTETSAPGVGKVIEENGKGVWVVGNAKDLSSGSFSATVKLLFDAATDVQGACVYASNYPPMGKYTSAAEVAFTGTPPYDLTFNYAGSTFTLPSGSTYLLPTGYILLSFTDATGAPGTFLCIPPAAPTVAKGEFCYGASGALVASVANSATIEWYDAFTGGTLLGTGEVLSLTPLYNTSAQYYAQAVSDMNCRSVRTNAEYTVSNCAISGDCPNYTAGNVGANTTPPFCAAHYAGQIGATNYPVACVAFDAGRIGN